ncbi:MAG: hypothetical protein GY794_04085 [bacterium]|nr:hypothetical protein [bacterium]
METFDNDIRQFRSQIFEVLSLRYALMTLTGWAIVWGAVSLILRTCGWASSGQLLWGLLGIIPCIAGAVMLASRSIPPEQKITAALDQKSAAGGLMMAGLETDIGQWNSTISTNTHLRCSWQGRNWWLALIGAGTFAIAMLLLPNRILATSPNHVLDINREVHRLDTQIETLKRERIIQPEQAETLQEKLNRLRNEATGEDPVKTWEALDHIEKIVQDTTTEAAEKLNAQKDKLDSAQALAEALAKTSIKDKVDSKTLTEAMKALSEMTRKACSENQSVSDKMKEALEKACKDGKLTQEQLKELTDAMNGDSLDNQNAEGRELSQEQLEELSKAISEGGQELAETLKELAEAGMIEGGPHETPPSDCEGAGGGEGELVDFIEENMGEGSIEELVELWRNGGGRGGINRGRGDADMTWSKGTDPKDAKFKPKVLSPAAVASLKESKLTGVSMGNPNAKIKRSDDGSGALSGAAAGGGSANTHTILPRHRGTVRRYFDRGKK